MWRSLLLIAWITVAVAACSTLHSETYEQPTQQELEEAYQRAVQDAEYPEARDIYRDLVAIAAHQDQLIWEGEPDQSRLLVATWTDNSFAPVNTSGEHSTEGDTWVTVAPKLKEFCSALEKPPEAVELRLAQLLGLPPNTEYDRIAEFWVEPHDLFRPCPDPQITDSQCELNYPQPEHLIEIDSTHITWMDDTAAGSYGENGYPWTRLGYTYDWGSEETNVGLSEFVVRPEVNVTIEAVTTTESYCK